MKTYFNKNQVTSLGALDSTRKKIHTLWTEASLRRQGFIDALNEDLPIPCGDKKARKKRSKEYSSMVASYDRHYMKIWQHLVQAHIHDKS